MTNEFRPAWWLRGGHPQTLWAALSRWRCKVRTRKEILELDDGDFLDLRWVGGDSGPIVIIVHGLQGSVASAYVRGMLRAVETRGWRGVLVHFRGCGDQPNRLPISYHSGFTRDLDWLVGHLRQGESAVPIAVIGYSLGGNVVLKWLAGRGDAAGVRAAAAISVPFDLAAAAERISQGASRIYQHHLLTSLRRRVRQKLNENPGILQLNQNELAKLRTFYDFDDRVTAPLHGFSGADDYYTRSSSGPLLHNITVPTLIIHAKNDPLIPDTSIPKPEALPAAVTMKLTNDGGHLGFVGGKWPWQPQYWLEQFVPAYLATFID